MRKKENHLKRQAASQARPDYIMPEEMFLAVPFVDH